MARYVSLLKFTDQGAREIKKSASRAHSFADAAKKAGVTIKDQFWLLGSYDGILIVEADSEAKALHWLTELASAGNVRTETMQAFDESEFKNIAG